MFAVFIWILSSWNLVRRTNTWQRPANDCPLNCHPFRQKCGKFHRTVAYPTVTKKNVKRHIPRKQQSWTEFNFYLIKMGRHIFRFNDAFYCSTIHMEVHNSYSLPFGDVFRRTPVFAVTTKPTANTNLSFSLSLSLANVKFKVHSCKSIL